MQREKKKETRVKRKRKKNKYFINTFQCMISVTPKIICEKVYLNQIMQYLKVHQLKSLFISSICFIYKSKLIKLYPRYLSYNAKIATRNPTHVFMENIKNANQEHNLSLSYTVNYQHDLFGILINVLLQINFFLMNIRYHILLSFRNNYVYIKLDKINTKNLKK